MTVPCGICGRGFSKDRVSTHQSICRKLKRKRGQFESVNQRLGWVEDIVGRAVRDEKPLREDWRSKREAFLKKAREDRTSPGSGGLKEIKVLAPSVAPLEVRTPIPVLTDLARAKAQLLGRETPLLTPHLREPVKISRRNIPVVPVSGPSLKISGWTDEPIVLLPKRPPPVFDAENLPSPAENVTIPAAAPTEAIPATSSQCPTPQMGSAFSDSEISEDSLLFPDAIPADSPVAVHSESAPLSLPINNQVVSQVFSPACSPVGSPACSPVFSPACSPPIPGPAEFLFCSAQLETGFLTKERRFCADVPPRPPRRVLRMEFFPNINNAPKRNSLTISNFNHAQFSQVALQDNVENRIEGNMVTEVKRVRSVSREQGDSLYVRPLTITPSDSDSLRSSPSPLAERRSPVVVQTIPGTLFSNQKSLSHSLLAPVPSPPTRSFSFTTLPFDWRTQQSEKSLNQTYPAWALRPAPYVPSRVGLFGPPRHFQN